MGRHRGRPLRLALIVREECRWRPLCQPAFALLTNFTIKGGGNWLYGISCHKLAIATDKEVDAEREYRLEESPGTKGHGCRLTAGQGDLKDSVTENKPPPSRYLRPLSCLLGYRMYARRKG